MSDDVPTHSPALNETDLVDVAESTINQNSNIDSEGKKQHDGMSYCKVAKTFLNSVLSLIFQYKTEI